MQEITFKLEVPEGLEQRAGLAIEKLIRRLLEEIEFSLSEDILSESKLTKKQAFELANEVKSGIAERHGLS